MNYGQIECVVDVVCSVRITLVHSRSNDTIDQIRKSAERVAADYINEKLKSLADKNNSGNAGVVSGIVSSATASGVTAL